MFRSREEPKPKLYCPSALQLAVTSVNWHSIMEQS